MPQDQLSALLRAASVVDDGEALEAANDALKADKKNLAAQHTKVVALLKLDRFDDAVRVIAEGGVKLEAKCLLEKAYALYKAGRLNEAMAALNSVGLGKRSFQHVAAQVAYRAERFSEAEAIYARLADADTAHEANDLSINMEAARAQSEWKGVAPAAAAVPETMPESFELCYNMACAHIARSSLDTAARLLQRAANLCRASDDLTEQEKGAEMKPILVQQAYVCARLGDAQQALDLCRSLATEDHLDPDAAVVAHNNMSALQTEPANPFLLQRQAAAWTSGATKAQLFGFQSSILARNASVVDLQVHKADGVRHRTRKILAQAHHPTTRPEINAMSVVNAASETWGLDDKELLPKLVALLKKRPTNVGLVLTTVQLHLRRHNTGAALSVLETLLACLERFEEERDRDVRFSPGLVALTVSLMRAQARYASAKAELVKAATYWRNRPGASAASLLREAGLELAKSSDPEDLSLAASAFQRLRDENCCTPVVSAGLVAALAAAHAPQLERHIAQLPSVESLTGGIDVDALASMGVAVSLRSSADALKRAAPAETAGDRATKKRRRARLPKNYVEGKAPDPERWLPLRDRSTYRPRGKKGKRRAGEATQGGIVKGEETLDLVGGGGVKVEQASAAGSSNKKKKKGKK